MKTSDKLKIVISSFGVLCIICFFVIIEMSEPIEYNKEIEENHLREVGNDFVLTLQQTKIRNDL